MYTFNAVILPLITMYISYVFSYYRSYKDVVPAIVVGVTLPPSIVILIIFALHLRKKNINSKEEENSKSGLITSTFLIIK